MVSVIWVSLSPDWSLYSVQAGLQVVIAVLCFIGIFVFTRLCWQSSSLELAKNRPVSLPSLISIHTLSEVYDAAFLLRSRIFYRHHWKILAQCLIVLVLSTSTIVSGPLAKASTRLGTVVRTVTANGLQSNRVFDSYTYGYVQWNQTIFKLNNAGFPSDQLLDYLPDPEFDWVYRKDEWNSSWSMACNKTESQPITLFDTGKCATIYTEFPALGQIFPPYNFSTVYVAPFVLTQGFRAKDAMLFLTGWTPDLEANRRGLKRLTFSVASVLMSDLKYRSNTYVNNTCYFDRGDVGSSSYTLAQCEIEKTRRVNELDLDAAYPDHQGLSAVAQSYMAHFSPRLARASASNMTLNAITPDELIRFYQAYLVSKDTFTEHPVSRSISHKIQIPQISSTFLAFGSLVVALNAGGLLYILWFTWKHFDIVFTTPESKLDWAVQSISENNSASAAPNLTTTNPETGSLKRFSVVASMTSDTHLKMRKMNRLRAFFESARYGSHVGTIPAESVPLTEYASPMGTNAGDNHFRNLVSPTGAVSTSDQSMYDISPFEAQFAGYDTAYFANQSNRNPDYQVGHGDRFSGSTWNSRGYQRMGRPDA